jgi:hypothetical protein
VAEVSTALRIVLLCRPLLKPLAERAGLRSCDGAKVKEGRLIQERRKPMMKIIAAAAFLAAPWQPAHAQAIVGSIPEEFRGDWCQESAKDNIFKPSGFVEHRSHDPRHGPPVLRF